MKRPLRFVKSWWTQILAMACCVDGVVSLLRSHEGWNAALWPAWCGALVVTCEILHRRAAAERKNADFWRDRHKEVARSMDVMRSSAEGWLLP